MELAFLKAKQSVGYLIDQTIEQYQDHDAIQRNVFTIAQVLINGTTKNI